MCGKNTTQELLIILVLKLFCDSYALAKMKQKFESSDWSLTWYAEGRNANSIVIMEFYFVRRSYYVT